MTIQPYKGLYAKTVSDPDRLLLDGELCGEGAAAPLDPLEVDFIRALARADARRDYAAAEKDVA